MDDLNRNKQMALLWLKLAVVYLVLGVAYGTVISATGQFQYQSVHAHINLLGWASLALAGLMYHLYPIAARSRLGYGHFVLHNVGAPVMLIALHFYVGGNALASAILPPASIITGLGIVAFALNVFVNMKATSVAQPLAEAAS